MCFSKSWRNLVITHKSKTARISLWSHSLPIFKLSLIILYKCYDLFSFASVNAVCLDPWNNRVFEQLAANSLSIMPKTIKGFSTADFLHLSFNIITEPRCSDIVNFTGFTQVYQHLNNRVSKELCARGGIIRSWKTCQADINVTVMKQSSKSRL